VVFSGNEISERIWTADFDTALEDEKDCGDKKNGENYKMLEKSIEIISIDEEEPGEKDIEIMKNEPERIYRGELKLYITEGEFLGVIAAVSDFKMAVTREIERLQLEEKIKACAAAYNTSKDTIRQMVNGINSENFWKDEAEEILGKLTWQKEEKKKYHNFRDELPKKSRKRKKW